MEPAPAPQAHHALEHLEHHYNTINGIRMHYVQAGTNPDTVLLLLHGFPEYWYSWRHQLAALHSRYTLVAPDLRGYNETAKPPFIWDYTITTLMADMLHLLDTLGHQQAVIVGHNWGGMLAWYLGIYHPHRVKRLIIMNTPHPVLFADAIHTNPRQMLRSTYLSLFQVPFLPELYIRANNFAALETMLRTSTARPDTFSDADIQAYKDALRKPGALAAAINWYRAFISLGGNVGTFFGPQKHVPVPTMLLWGEQDPFLGKELSVKTNKFVPDLRTHYLPDSAHWIQQEQPDLVNTYITEFLSDMT
jgi:epoxide hydrolase 4